MSPTFTDADPIEIDTAETATAVEAGTAVLLDVREDDEREAGFIEPSSHIPMGALSTRAGELPQDADVIVYCRVGGRSRMAAEALRAAGIPARSMAGGILAWDGEGRPLAPDGSGTVAPH